MTAQAIVTCPECGVASREVMPEDACRYFYDCPACATTMRPRTGDCCVFCSYGDSACPPKQAG